MFSRDLSGKLWNIIYFNILEICLRLLLQDDCYLTFRKREL